MLSEKQTALVEKMGIHFEQTIPPAAARIFSLLIVSEQESFSFDEIRDQLNLSKSATSNGLNFLLSMKKSNTTPKVETGSGIFDGIHKTPWSTLKKGSSRYWD
jgi:DNA-binding transcriptional regulator GbsR (MarR family)